MDIKDKNLEILYDYIKQGEKPVKEYKIGVEFEHFVLNLKTGTSIKFEEMEKIFRILVKNKLYKPVLEKNHIVSLFNDTESLTIEPGAQLEISINPQKNINTIFKIYDRFLKNIIPLLKNAGYFMLSIGYHPIQKNSEITLVPKKRYSLMHKYFLTTGVYGRNMMRSTNTIHINLDYSNEQDFKQIFLLVQKLTPFANLFFANNSPFADNMISDTYFKRIISWFNTDPARCGFIRESFDTDSFGYLRYAKKVFNTPMIISLENNRFNYQGHKTYSQYLKTNKLTKENLTNQLTMLFPVIRAKQYIEIRLSDGLKKENKIFPILFWKSIIYNKKNREYLLDYTENWTFEDVNQLLFQVIHEDYKIKKFKKIKFTDIIDKILEISFNGLNKDEQKKYIKFTNFVQREKKTFAEYEILNFKKTNKDILTYLKEDYEDFNT